MSDRSTRINLENDQQQVINPATEDKQDDIIVAIEAISDQQVATDLEWWWKISVWTTAVEVTFTWTTESIIITADVDNTWILYIGKSNVDNTWANAVTPLYAWQSATLDYDDDSNAIYVVSDTVSQNFWKGALL